MKNIFAINGSAGKNSSNGKLIENFAGLTNDCFNVTVFNYLKTLPHFDPELSLDNTPEMIVEFRTNIEKADGILICSPEYVYSIPSGLKNAIEWCVSTTVFSDKAVGFITAAACGQKAHDELKLIMKTVMARFSEKTMLLIPGIKAKINEQGEITDNKTMQELVYFIDAYKLQLGIVGEVI